MTNSRSNSDVRTVNGQRYRHANARVVIARCNGLPIAFRRIVVVGQPGSFAGVKAQAVTAARITPLSKATAQRLIDTASFPLN